MFDWLFWRPTRARVRRRADAMIHAHGDIAFFRAHEQAWAAQGAGKAAQARFWQAVCAEIARQVQRNTLVRGILLPRTAARPTAEVILMNPRGAPRRWPQEARVALA